MTRIDETWCWTCGTGHMRVTQVFGSARPCCAYLIANKRRNRKKVLVRDGLGICCVPAD